MSKGLKALKKLCKNNAIDIYDHDDKKELKIIEKSLKALEIIKKKKVDVGALCELDLELYNKYVKEINGTSTLTQKEYDLLQEELL